MFAEVFSYDREIEDRAAYKKAVEMAKSALENSLPTSLISTMTGLSAQEIERLTP